jgi:quercetin dioxygenase-like cupin family protein
MNKILAIAVVGLSLSAFAQEKAKPKNYTLTPAADVKWNDVPDMKGIKHANVEGDSTKGAHHSMMKFDAGFTAPAHHHTSDHYVTVVQGTLVLTIDGVETKLPAGSYFQIMKKTPHATKCESGTDCILALDVRGKWDVVMPKEKEGKKEAAVAPAPEKK